MKITVNYQNLFIGLLTLFIASSCDFGVNEIFLGNNLYLSEYDCVDRRILYQTKKQSNSGVEIIPMTVSEFAYNKNWIIVKSNDSKGKEIKYWIILNQYHKTPSPAEVKEKTLGPLSQIEFNNIRREKKIELVLKKIECK